MRSALLFRILAVFILLAFSAALQEQSVALNGAAQSSSQIKAGERLFALSCSIGYCHGVGGSAGRGPRLKEREWDKGYLYKTIANGIPSTAMPGWQDKFTQQQISSLVSYILSLSPAHSEFAPLPTSDMPKALPINQAGKDLFFDPTNDRNCGVCHRLQESGATVGPALDNLAKKSQPEILAYLRQQQAAPGNSGLEVRTASGETICGVKVKEDATQLQLYDLPSEGPPVLRSLTPPEIVHQGDCPSLPVHAGLSARYTRAQLAAIAAFIKLTAH